MTPPGGRTPNRSPAPQEGYGGVGPSQPTDAELRKRVVKACDRCRLKKIKCDGQLPCSRCQSDNSVCRYVERKRSTDRRIPPGYIEYLEDQQGLLVSALKKSWAQTRGQASGSSTPAATDIPIHRILEELGVLSDFPNPRSGEAGFEFQEDTEELRRTLEAHEQQREEEGGEALLSAAPTTQASSPDSMRSFHSGFFQEGGMITEAQAESSSQAQMRAGGENYGTYEPSAGLYMSQSGMQQPMPQQVFGQYEWPILRQSQTPYNYRYPYGASPAQPYPPQQQQATTGQSARRPRAGQSVSTQHQQQQHQTHGQQTQVNLDVSTVSPQDLTLPSAGPGSLSYPEEEAWSRWLSEHGQNYEEESPRNPMDLPVHQLRSQQAFAKAETASTSSSASRRLSSNMDTEASRNQTGRYYHQSLSSTGRMHRPSLGYSPCSPGSLPTPNSEQMMTPPIESGGTKFKRESYFDMDASSGTHIYMGLAPAKRAKTRARSRTPGAKNVMFAGDAETMELYVKRESASPHLELMDSDLLDLYQENDGILADVGAV